MSDRSLMRPQKPTFEQRNDPMHPRQQMLGVGRLTLLDLPIVNVAFHFAVRLQAIGHHGAARFDGLADEAVQRGPIRVGYVLQPDAPDAASIGLKPPQ
jgi:hypothetical protein